MKTLYRLLEQKKNEKKNMTRKEKIEKYIKQNKKRYFVILKA